MLTYRKFEGLEIIRYFDSDFAICQDSKRSTFDTSTCWLEELSLGTPSTIAVEFVACFEASNHGIWLQNFVTSLSVVDGIKKLLKIYCDNNLTILYSNNNRSSTKSNFIGIKFLVIKERVQNKQIFIKYIGTSFMLADPLTKELTLKIFHEHIAHM
ncbi:Copia protein, partial [Mucuna pruriens]